MEIKKDGDKLTIVVDLDPKGHPSSTGKTTILFSSRGFQWEQDLGINLTIVKSKFANAEEK